MKNSNLIPRRSREILALPSSQPDRVPVMFSSTRNQRVLSHDMCNLYSQTKSQDVLFSIPVIMRYP